MQHDYVLTKVNFDLLTPRVRGSVGRLLATMLLHFVIPIHGHVLKTLNFDLLTPSARVMGEGVCSQNICYQVPSFRDSVNLICNMTMF